MIEKALVVKIERNLYFDIVSQKKNKKNIKFIYKANNNDTKGITTYPTTSKHSYILFPKYHMVIASVNINVDVLIIHIDIFRCARITLPIQMTINHK